MDEFLFIHLRAWTFIQKYQYIHPKMVILPNGIADFGDFFSNFSTLPIEQIARVPPEIAKK